MKKALIAISILICVAVLIACAAPSLKAPTGAFSKADLGVNISGRNYYLREDSAPILAVLGSSYDYSEMVSCVYDGKDKTFAYPGIKVNTIPAGGKDMIEMITLTDANYETLRGIRVGDDMDKLIAAYGENYFDDGYITYSLTNDPYDIQSERIQFYFENGVINTIYIYSPSY